VEFEEIWRGWDLAPALLGWFLKSAFVDSDKLAMEDEYVWEGV